MGCGEKGKVTEFQWITSFKVTERNAEKTAGTRGLRWKIENERFNRQKNWDGDITHACSHNANALKKPLPDATDIKYISCAVSKLWKAPNRRRYIWEATG